MKKQQTFLVTALVMASLLSCKSKIETVSGYYDYETECVSVDREGIETVKAWGLGKTEKEAILNARRRAVDEIMFKGVRGGRGGCSVRPLISNPNIRRDRDQYFYRFFAENGDFEKYAGLPDENWLRRKLKVNQKNTNNRAYEIVIEVDVQGLKRQLQQDQIIQ